MDTTVLTNILFASLSIFLIFITVGFVALIVVVVSIFKKISKGLDMVNKETEKILADINNVRDFAKKLLIFFKKKT